MKLAETTLNVAVPGRGLMFCENNELVTCFLRDNMSFIAGFWTSNIEEWKWNESKRTMPPQF
jgi:hypothetical protein